MTKRMTTHDDKERGQRLRRARNDAGLSTSEVASFTGQSEETVRSHEKGARGVRLERAEQYARLYGVSVEWIIGLASPAATVTVPTASVGGIRVVGTVAAGVFRESLEMPDAEQERLPIQADRTYGTARQFALLVQGSSMNLVYPEGTYVICVSSGDTESRFGDHVVCQRARHGVYEFTLKELIRDAKSGKPRLMPRSNDPLHQNPIDPQGGDIEIVAVVIGSYHRRPRRGLAVSDN